MMKIVFWLDPMIGFDRNTPEILAKMADNLTNRGYEVELLIEDQNLDEYKVELATRRVSFPETQQQIVADLLISNSLLKLARMDLHRVGGRIWLALDDDVTTAVEIFEDYQLYEVVQVITFYREIQKQLLNMGIQCEFIQPGLPLEKFKSFAPKEKKHWGITICFFDTKPEVLNQVLQGVEMTVTSLNRLQVHLITDQDYKIKSSFAIETRVKPSLEERIRIYEQSDIILQISGRERFSLIPLEGMAVGIPVILLQHSGSQAYAKDRENSLILTKTNPTEIALSILNIIKFGKVRQKIKNYGLKTVQEYDLNNGMEEFDRILQKSSVVKLDFVEELDANENHELVDIVIVNHNGGLDIRECLSALKRYTNTVVSPLRIIVVDNGSSDDSLTYLKQEEEITLIANQSNMGYAKAGNQGILAGKGEYIILLHSDSKVTEGWLEPLLKEVKKPDIGMVIPLIVPFVNDDVFELTELGRGFDLQDEALIAGPVEDCEEEVQWSREADTADIGCRVIKRSMLNQIGLLDEAFFLYFEDVDYNLRIREKGYQISHVPESVVVHNHESAWERLSQEVQIERDQYVSQSKGYFKSKWGSLYPGSASRREVDGVILLSLHPWQKRAQRTEAVIDYLTRQGQKIVYVEPFCAANSPRVLGQGQYIYTPKGSGTIYHNILNSGRRVEMLSDLKKNLTEWGIKKPLLWIEAPWWEPAIKHLEHLFQVYSTPESLLENDLETFQQLRARFKKGEEEICTSADLIITGSKRRLEELREYKDKAVYSPGGFYPTDLERFLNGNYTIPDELFYLPGPKLGIVGTFNRYFPRHLLERLAVSNPEVSIVFIGEITCELKELREITNLYFLGYKDWENLLDCLYFFDVMLYPYQDKNLNSYLDSYLINYFLAMGKPVIAFEHRELERFGLMVQKAQDEEGFIRLVREIIGELESEKSAERIKQRIHQIKGHSWEQRLDDIFTLISAKVSLADVMVIQVSDESKPEEEKESFLTMILRQLAQGYQRLFKINQDKLE